jgi:hypothetical protein
MLDPVCVGVKKKPFFLNSHMYRYRAKPTYIENNTWLQGNVKLISNISLDILVNMRNKLVFPTRTIHVLFCLLYKKLPSHLQKFVIKKYDPINLLPFNCF